jgi:hypothetical protein
MKEILDDINLKLTEGFFVNEEHVRLSLVARVLQQLGWDIWNPREVNPEYYCIPNEDRSRVDIALFLTPQIPSVFFEIKAVGKIDTDLANIERQLRDYNRNLTALFSIITDGRKWRFYYSQAGGEFSQKCFKVLDLFEDDFDDIDTFFRAFLSKSEIASGNAEQDARSYLQLSQKQRAMDDALPQARRMVDQLPFPSLPQALVERVLVAGFKITLEEAFQFIQNYKPVDKLVPASQPPPQILSNDPPVRRHSDIEKLVPSDYTAGPEALRQILEVTELMFFKKTDFGDAAVQVARRRNITHSTVRHHCTRALGLDTYEFKALLQDRTRTITFLQKKFPQYSDIILERLNK